MTDDLELAGLGGAALNEGIRFLYAQAGEVLKSRRERSEADAAVTDHGSEAVTRGTVKARDVDGSVTAVLADPSVGPVEAEVEVRNVRRGGRVVGVDLRAGVADRGQC